MQPEHLATQPLRSPCALPAQHPPSVTIFPSAVPRRGSSQCFRAAGLSERGLKVCGPRAERAATPRRSTADDEKSTACWSTQGGADEVGGAGLWEQGQEVGECGSGRAPRRRSISVKEKD
eukprot:CAMPEP_0177693268 /NCGR_PEP_ID=MMETSP0484_2-20121128/2305_1 /TAXON_ID=354590 /ORGANISM="Rhodomonas lens, Strain RHODO" /LENGTH=119 /DNA_ID=CAMNT_0019204059 /DNA_START=49 /DNA_END=405 /DNA_ORIENTATION=-